MIDDREKKFPIKTKTIAKLCNRRFGIGADGLILLQQEKDYFKMIYFNADGNQSTMCGNGGRCFVQFLYDLKLIEKEVDFLAIDGRHHAAISDGLIHLEMQNVSEVQEHSDYFFLNTGSPHHVIFSSQIEKIDVKKNGTKIRYSTLYPEGTNVNFVEMLTPNRLFVRTYERGVEDETYSCGTGVTAAALAYAQNHDVLDNIINIKTLGGNLKVSFEKNQNGFESIYLIGPATFVYKGKIKI